MLFDLFATCKQCYRLTVNAKPLHVSKARTQKSDSELNRTLRIFKMVSSFFIAVVTILWVTFATTVTSQSPSLELEALLKTGWWNSTNPDMSSSCNWNGIACDEGGRVTMIDRRHNELKGTIPPEIGNFSKLTHLDLSYNNVSGELPISLARLTQLKELFLCHNHITGSIPLEISNLENLMTLDLSFNILIGPIPHGFQSRGAFIGNKDLCGDITGFPPCPRPIKEKKLLLWKILLPINIFLAVLIFGYLFVRMRYIFPAFKFSLMSQKIQCEGEGRATKNGDLFSIWTFDGNIAYEDIINATENFNIKYCIGMGSCGSLYKAQLPSGKVVALKKLHSIEAHVPGITKSFQNEIKILTNIRHRNIVRLHGYCVHKRCNFLIYEYMERRNLYWVLSSDVEAKELTWKIRVNIIRGIAHALSYLHHDSNPSIVHRDITSSNILLNSELEAFVADFGMARFIDPTSSNPTKLAGTYGYMAPGILFLTNVLLLISSKYCAFFFLPLKDRWLSNGSLFKTGIIRR